MPQVVAVSIDFWDTSTASEKILRLCSMGPLTGEVEGGVRAQWIPTLYLPIRVGSSIEAEQYGDSITVHHQNSNIEFAVTDEILIYIKDYAAIGRSFRIFTGDFDITKNDLDEITGFGLSFENFVLAYTGRIEEVSYDAARRRASLSFTGARLDLNKPLIFQTYGIGPTSPATSDTPIAIRETPKPELFGEGYSLEPTLEDEGNLIYRISQNAIWSCMWLLVGGIPWDEVATAPGPGQWCLIGNAIQLGGPPLGGQVRVRARALGYETETTGSVVSWFVETGGGILDPNSVAELAADAPYLIGYYAKEPINKQDAIDDIMRGVGGWWGDTSSGNISAGLIKKPEYPVVAEYTAVNVMSMELLRIMPPALRIRVEWRRNWQPGTQFYDFVTENEKSELSADGVIAPAWELGDEATIKTQQPKAVDVPVIRSLVQTEIDAIAIRHRLAEAWGVQRKIWRLEIIDAPPELMDTVEVNFQDIIGIYRVTAILRSFGGGFNEVVLWG